MKFFIPYADDDAQAERVIAATAEFVGASVPQLRIQRLEYTHNSMPMVAEVGHPVHSYYRERNPIVIAILKRANCYLVCLAERGVARGEPILVGEHAVQGIEHFDERSSAEQT